MRRLLLVLFVVFILAALPLMLVQDAVAAVRRFLNKR